MKKIILFVLIIIQCIGCASDRKDTTIELSDLNLFLTTDIHIDSVFVSNITQDREFQFMPYENTLTIDFNDSINDLYNISFYTEKGVIMNQLWLDGKNLTIKGKVTNKLEIDTVIGSNLYYTSIDFKKRYKQLKDQKTDSVTINEFLVHELEKHIDTPLSIDISGEFFYRNLQNKEALRKVYEILLRQDENIKNHLLNNLEKIKKVLTVSKIDFSNFKFYDIENQVSTISTQKDKRYLVDFWFLNCPPCIVDHKSINDDLDYLKSKNVELISISTDENYEKWNSYLSKNNYNWLHYREVDNYEERITTDLLISAFPTYILLDDKGEIQYRSNSFYEIKRVLGE